jgi:hypothetical protein
MMSFILFLLCKSSVVVDINIGEDLFLQFFFLNFLKKNFPFILLVDDGIRLLTL